MIFLFSLLFGLCAAFGEIEFTSALKGDIKCGDAVALTWKYKDATKIQHGDQLRVQIRENGAFSNPLIQTIDEFFYDGNAPKTSFTFTFPTIPPEAWLDDIKIDGSRNQILFHIEKVGDSDVNSSQKNCALCGFEPAFTFTCCPQGYKKCQCLMNQCYDEGWECKTDEGNVCGLSKTAMQIMCGDGGAEGCQCRSGGKCDGLLECKLGACVDTIGNPKGNKCEKVGAGNACERHPGGLVPTPFSCNPTDMTCTECPVGALNCACDINRRCAPGVNGESIRCDNTGRCRADTGCQGCPCVQPLNTCNGANLKCLSGTCISDVSPQCQAGTENCECAQQANGVFGCNAGLRCVTQRCVRSGASTLIVSTMALAMALFAL